MSKTFNEIILSNENLIEQIVTPLTPYFICNHYFSIEICNTWWKSIDYNLEIKANNLLKNRNYNDIKENDIILVQSELLYLFYVKILPIIIGNNIKIILITSQWQLPQIYRNNITDNLLNHKNIVLWISQNPIYENHDKYMAFPYGIRHHDLERYINYIRTIGDNYDKNKKIINEYASTYSHLGKEHIRIKHEIFGKKSGNKMEYTEYLEKIRRAEYVISTSGDRDDCYRHYECIGLYAIPVSNISGGYKEIFGENMIYSNAEEMINMINKNEVDKEYKRPNREILTISYWKGKIEERVR